jgi:hypothetical protein
MPTVAVRPYPLLALALAAGCGAAPSAPPPVAHTARGDEPSTAAPPCPVEPRLAELARRAWDKPAGTIATVGCAALVVGGEPAWFIKGVWEDGDQVGLWEALLTPGGEVRWVDGSDGHPYGTLMRLGDQRLAPLDLDGDGGDEVLLTQDYGRGGYWLTTLVVYAVTARRVRSLNDLDPIVLETDNEGSFEQLETGTVTRCDGALATPPAPGGGHLLEVTYTGQCDRTGRRAWRYDGRALVEVSE